MKYGLAFLMSSIMYVSSAMANSPPQGNGHGMAVQDISRDLAVMPEQFTHCFDTIRPKPGERSGPGDRRLANKKILLECLQKVNAAITGHKLDEVMDRYRPPERQPMGPPPGMQNNSQPPGGPAMMGRPLVLKNDPKRPVKAISHDLGVRPEQFVECFNHVNPTPGGARPESADRVHANKRALLSCLQKANPKITNEILDKVMDRYRPGGRAAQVPMRQ